MSGKEFEIINTEREHREHREHREQPTNILDLSCSHKDVKNGNIGISSLITRVEHPLVRPCYKSYSVCFNLDGEKKEAGLYYHRINNQGMLIDEYISLPLDIIAITSSQYNDNFGRLLKFQDSNGLWHEWAMPMTLLKGNGDELLSELLYQGFTFEPSCRKKILSYLMTEKPAKKIKAVDAIGWHGDNFVLPNQVIGSDVDNIVFQSDTINKDDFHCNGTLEGWQDEIGKYCVGNIPFIISVSVALVGPLMKPSASSNNVGVHFVGDSSSGKTTSVEVGASVWGGKDFKRSWRTTANGFEGIAAARNDTCLVLDDIDEVSPKDIGNIVYMIGNGQGKQRADRAGDARRIKRWNIGVLSTGESEQSGVMNEIGKRPNQGQKVRLLSLPVSFEFGAFSNLHGFQSGRELADHLKSERLKHYGHIGPAFVRCLVKESKDLSERLDRIVQDFSKHVTTGLEKRAASMFGLIGFAGELGIEYGLLPWPQGSALEAALIALKMWHENNGPGNNEDQEILQLINDFIDKHGDSRFSSLSLTNNMIRDRAGYYQDKNDQRIYMFFPNGLMEAAGGRHSRNRVVDALKRNGCIVEHDNDRITKKTRTPNGLSNLYYVCINKEKL